MNIFYCRIPQILVEAAVPQCNQRVVIEELNKFLGCRDDISKIKEDSSTTANRWVGFTRRLAIEMSVSTPLGNNDVGHTAADAVGANPNPNPHANPNLTPTLNLTHASSYADTY